MLEPTTPAWMFDPTALQNECRRCRRQTRTLLIVELVQTELAFAILVIVALCGIVAVTHDAVASGDVALPLGLGLAVTVALGLHVLAYRARMGHDASSKQLYQLECARRSAAAQAREGEAPHPYRSSAGCSVPRCAYCLLVADALPLHGPVLCWKTNKSFSDR